MTVRLIMTMLARPVVVVVVILKVTPHLLHHLQR